MNDAVVTVAILLTSALLGGMATWALVVAIEQLGALVNRRQERARLRAQTERELARIDREATASVTRIQAAYWQAQQLLRDEAEGRHRG